MSRSTLVYRLGDWVRRVAECLRTDPALVAQLAFWRISLPALKRIVNVNVLAEYMWSPPSVRFDDAERQRRVDAVKRVVKQAGRMFVSGNCLERSLMLFRVLSQAGAQPTLVLGARHGAPSVAGHAWIELDGQPLFESDADAYAPVVSFGLKGSVQSHVRSLA